MICYECEHWRPLVSLNDGLTDALYIKLENEGHLQVQTNDKN